MLGALADEGLLGVVRGADGAAAVRAARALIAGGLRCVELTLTTPGALAALERLRAEAPDGVVVGMGTVRSASQARDACAAGAEFLVSPHGDPRLVEAMLATGLPALPGVLTPTEVAAALDAGAGAVKLFPASTVGPAHVRALRGPFPGLPVVATGGIALTDLGAWFAAGVLAVGAGGELTGDGAQREAARRWRDAVDVARGGPR